MVDIHCHFLPGLDDGARESAHTAEMLRVAHASGTTDIVATPHADTEYVFDPEQVALLLEDVRALAPDGLRLHRGCDFHLMHDNVSRAMERPRDFTVNGGRYLLVELSDMVIFENTTEIFERLEALGLVIIITHPERNPLLRQRFELLEQWVEAGRLMQLTASSLTGLWGRRVQDFSARMLDRGIAHVVASDGHDPKVRQPRLDEARQWLERRYWAALAECLLETHPRAVIEDREIQLDGFPPPKPKSRIQRWFARNRTSGS